MKTAEFIEELRVEGERFADFAEKAGWDAPVPTCPEWRVRDLAGHLGNVHRWSAVYIAGETAPVPLADTRPEADGEMGAWLRDGLRTLVADLAAAPTDRACWTFLPAPDPIAFWARRQAHETAVHRFDVESALTPGTWTEPDPGLALDGIDELVAGFHARGRSKVRSAEPCTLRIRATTGGAGEREWLLHLSPEAPRVETDPGPGAADCVVTGPAGTLYRALWNRSGFEGTEVAGDASLVDLWRRTSVI